MNSEGDAIVFADSKFPKSVHIATDNSTVVASSAGLSGNYQPVEEQGMTLAGTTNTFSMKVDGTTINTVNGKLENNAQFKFDSKLSQGVALTDGKLSVAIGNEQLTFKNGALAGNLSGDNSV